MHSPVYYGLILDQPKQSRLVVARLWFRGYRADLHKTEADLGQAVDGFAVLVEAGRQTDRVRELQVEQIGLQIRIDDLAAFEIRANAEFGALDRFFVRGAFGRERE